MAKKELSFVAHVESVLYKQESSQFAVVKLRDVLDNQQGALKEGMTAIGTLADMRPGMRIAGKGYVGRDNRNKKQLKIRAFQARFPRDMKNVLSFLTSGDVPFVGNSKRLALDLIYKSNGGEIPKGECLTLNRLVESPDSFQIPGVGPKVIDRLSQWMREEAERVAKVNSLVADMGVNRKMALEWSEELEMDPLTMLMVRPYEFAPLLDIDFKDIDDVGKQILGGVDLISARYPSAILDVFRKNLDHGSTAISYRVFEDELADRLDDMEQVEQAINAAHHVRLFSFTRLANDGVVQYFNDAHTDMEIGRELNRIATATPRIHKKHWEVIEPEQGLGKDQRKGVFMALGSNVSILTGGPGTGKTTTVRTILDNISEEGCVDGAPARMTLAAPSGLAAKRMTESTKLPAATVHKTLDLTPGGEPQRNRGNPLDADVVVFDESSMMDSEIFLQSLRAVPSGAKLVIVGDPDQLPSVGPGNVLADLIEANNKLIPNTRLKEVFRNAGPIAFNAHAINDGKMPEIHGLPQSNEENRDWNVCMLANDAEKKNMLRWLVSTEIPQNYGFQHKDIQVLSPQHEGELGTISLNRMLQEIINPMSPDKEQIYYRDFAFRTGDKVMYRSNNPAKGLVNGDIGYIQAIDRKSYGLVVKFDDGDVSLDKKDLASTEIAYCLSVHKSQGSEYPVAILPMSDTHRWTRQLYYTGITRGKSHVFSLTDKSTLEKAVNDTRKEPRVTGLVAGVHKANIEGSPYELAQEGMNPVMVARSNKPEQNPKAEPESTQRMVI